MSLFAPSVDKVVRHCSHDNRLYSSVMVFLNAASFRIQNDLTIKPADKAQLSKWVRNSGSTYAPYLVSKIKTEHPDVYGNLVNLYPYLLHNIVNIFDTAEHKVLTYTNTAYGDRQDWELLLADEKHALKQLYLGYPLDMASIFYAFPDDFLNPYTVHIVNRGDFTPLFRFLVKHGVVNQYFRETANRYMEFATRLSECH